MRYKTIVINPLGLLIETDLYLKCLNDWSLIEINPVAFLEVYWLSRACARVELVGETVLFIMKQKVENAVFNICFSYDWIACIAFGCS